MILYFAYIPVVLIKAIKTDLGKPAVAQISVGEIDVKRPPGIVQCR